MRIVTGKYKGRHFDIPRSFKARPTTDFAKENIFNVLQGYIDFEDTAALDLFAGTGSISLELLSRGCSSVVSVELDRDHARFIQQCVDKLAGGRNDNLNDNLNLNDNGKVLLDHTLIRGDVFKFLKSCKRQFDFIFADPPYALPTLPEIPDKALPLLKDGGILVFEHGKQNAVSAHPRFIDHRSYGSVNFSIFR